MAVGQGHRRHARTPWGGFRLSSARELADEYLRDSAYMGNSERVDALIRWETTKSFTAGFVGGLGGVLTIPISVPGTLVAAWIVHARMAAAIACICGHDPDEDRVQTFILLSLLGASALDAVKQAGVQIGTKASTHAIKADPRSTPDCDQQAGRLPARDEDRTEGCRELHQDRPVRWRCGRRCGRRRHLPGDRETRALIVLRQGTWRWTMRRFTDSTRREDRRTARRS